jgi:hypothetical protein
MMGRKRLRFNEDLAMDDPADPARNAAPNGVPAQGAAERALAEAKARRAAYRAREAALPKEIGGRGGMEPGRYGDWEVKGLASDF